MPARKQELGLFWSLTIISGLNKFQKKRKLARLIGKLVSIVPPGSPGWPTQPTQPTQGQPGHQFMGCTHTTVDTGQASHILATSDQYIILPQTPIVSYVRSSLHSHAPQCHYSSQEWIFKVRNERVYMESIARKSYANKCSNRISNQGGGGQQ